MTDPTDDIMEATFCALCRHGYADLTMEDIAEEADRSKASLHYHYDSKHALLVAFLDWLFDRFVDRVDPVDDAMDGSDEGLRSFVADVLHPPNEDSTREFRRAILEIEAQAPYDEAFQERLVRFDAFIAGTIRDLVATGVESGVYREEVDPDEVARFVVTLVAGAQRRHVVADADVDAVQAAIESYLDARRPEPRGASP